MTNPSPLAPLGFVFHTFISQVVALGVALLTWEVFGSTWGSVLSAVVATLSTALFLRLPTPWKLVNAILPLTAALSLTVSLPSWLFVVPFIGLALLHTPALWTRVPYYPTSRAAYPLILAELPAGEAFTFIDIGCGFGDLLVFLQKHRPLGRYYGVEIGVLPYLVSKGKSLTHGGGAISVSFKDLNRLDLSEFDYIYAFLSPAAMTSLWSKARQEMRPGCTFITNSFEAPADANYTISIKDQRRGSLFVHKMEIGSSYSALAATTNTPV